MVYAQFGDVVADVTVGHPMNSFLYRRNGSISNHETSPTEDPSDDPTSDVLLIEDLYQQRLPARTLAAVLERAGYQAQLCHFGANSDPASVVELALRTHPRLIVSSILFADLVDEHLGLIAGIKAAGSPAHCTMVGALPTFAYAELLRAHPALDSVLRGESAIAIVSLMKALGEAPAGLSEVSGLAYRTSTIRVNSLPAPLLDLDRLPWPEPDAAALKNGFATVIGSKGCDHNCAFCLHRAHFRVIGGPCHRMRSIPSLVDEIESLYQRGARLFLFDDEQFLPPRHQREERVALFAAELRRRKLTLAFTLKCRADDVDKALFAQLKSLGLLRVYIGIESGCQRSLDLFTKGITVERALQALQTIDRLGLVGDFYSLLFHPWSTLADLESEIAFLEAALPSMTTCYSIRDVFVFPGTPLAERLHAEGRLSGQPWAYSYQIVDPRVELMRRMSRIVFASLEVSGGFRDRLTQAWFDVLQRQRFSPNLDVNCRNVGRFVVQGLAPWGVVDELGEKANRLRSAASAMNHVIVDALRAMHAFATGPNFDDATAANWLAIEWAKLVNEATHIHREG